MEELPDPTADPAPQRLDYALASTPVVTLRSFYSALDAQIHANALADAGIAYNLLGGNTNTLGPYAAFSQVELQVEERDRQVAEKILQDLEATASTHDADEQLSEAAGDSEDPRCPQCASWQTCVVPAPWLGLMNFLFSRAPEQPRQLECLRCHYRWIAGPKDAADVE